jgi:hypothetical protein
MNIMCEREHIIPSTLLDMDVIFSNFKNINKYESTLAEI